MATTGELRAIIEELRLIDAGDAASFFGEETLQTEETLVSDPPQKSSLPEHPGNYTASTCDESSMK